MQIQARWRLKSLQFTGFVLTVLSTSVPARAQPSRNVDLPQLQPAPAGDRFFAVPSPYTPGNLVFRGGVLLDYAKNPLVVSDSAGAVVGHVVEHQLLLHLDVSLTLSDRVSFNADIPLALVNSGDGTVEAGAFTGTNAFVSPGGAGVGDLRLGGRLRIFGGYFDPFQIAAGGYLWLPTGTRNDYLTDANVRGQVQLLLGGLVDRFIWSAMGAPTFRKAQTYGDIQIGSQLNWGGGAGVLLGDARNVQLGVETIGGVTLLKSARSFNSEVLGGVKVRAIDPLELGVALGRGFSTGLGTPDYRALFTAFYTPKVATPTTVVDSDGDGIADPADACPTVKGIASTDVSKNGCPPPSDRDRDGIADDADACPEEAGPSNSDPKKNGCPPRDRDKDGVLDDVDACPDVAGVPSDDAKKNGCPAPADKDGDGVPDTQDACPDIPGIVTDNPATTGCPGDADGDGIRDDQDACPHEKGPDDADPKQRGCPKHVRVTATEIVILEQIQFETNKATIRPTSNELIDSIAQVMREHPEIEKFEVQGHTDDRGSKARNVKLSQQRADAVVSALVTRGVAADRLSAKGYGQDQPIAPNQTEEGRQKNRRVQFLVIAKKATGAAEAPATSP